MIRITLSAGTRQVLQLLSRQASAFGDGRVVGWIHAIRLVGEGHSIPGVSRLLDMGEQTVRDRVHWLLLHGPACLISRRSPGRPGRLTDHQKEELVRLISQGPLACGYGSGCWDSVMTAFRLPAYSPDFNPIEHLWKRVKKAATHLRYFPCFDDLVASA